MSEAGRWDVSKLVAEYERIKRTGAGVSEFVMWSRRAYNVLKQMVVVGNGETE